jgi:rubrerythrin
MSDLHGLSETEHQAMKAAYCTASGNSWGEEAWDCENWQDAWVACHAYHVAVYPADITERPSIIPANYPETRSLGEIMREDREDLVSPSSLSEPPDARYASTDQLAPGVFPLPDAEHKQLIRPESLEAALDAYDMTPLGQIATRNDLTKQKMRAAITAWCKAEGIAVREDETPAPFRSRMGRHRSAEAVADEMLEQERAEHEKTVEPNPEILEMGRDVADGINTAHDEIQDRDLDLDGQEFQRFQVCPDCGLKRLFKPSAGRCPDCEAHSHSLEGS